MSERPVHTVAVVVDLLRIYALDSCNGLLVLYMWVEVGAKRADEGFQHEHSPTDNQGLYSLPSPEASPGAVGTEMR